MRVYNTSTRKPRDVPVSTQQVRLLLHLRRFFCDAPACLQQTFAARLPELLPVRAQRTVRLTRSLSVLGFALGSRAGARTAYKLSLPTSCHTLLRLVRQTPAPAATPRVLGVDDFALRKGRVYGSILVDLEQHRPIDLLPDRRAETLEAWLHAHPSVEVIARDRSTEYARGATAGAPAALQVADRWHILKNYREAIERFAALADGTLARYERETRLRHSDGRFFWSDLVVVPVVPIQNAEGTFVAMLGETPAPPDVEPASA